MPAFLTHFSCGLMGFRSLRDGELKNIIRRHPTVYSMGLAGPDLFFYSVYELATAKEPVGRVMHKFRTGRFLKALYQEVQGMSEDGRDFHHGGKACQDKRAGAELKTGSTRDKRRTPAYEIALAYFCGFLGHYCLDSRAHALVYKVCEHPDRKVALGKHFRYEAAMDAMCCEKILGRNIRDSHQMGLLKLSRRERQVIARLLSSAIRKVYGDEIRTPSTGRLMAILREYYLISGILADPSGFKEWLAAGIECRLGLPGFPLASPLFINDNRYGLTDRDWDRFFPRFRRGAAALERALTLLDGGLRTGRLDQFWREVGSASYHGMHLKEAASDLPLRELLIH